MTFYEVIKIENIVLWLCFESMKFNKRAESVPYNFD